MKQKVLIVDDDKHITELISLYLIKDGFETITAADGEKAIEFFFAHSPDLVLLDVMLPKIDGFNVLSKIRSSSSVPVIMLTAKGETFDKVMGLELGADDYIVKPFEPKEMVARVRAVLRRFGQKEEKDGEEISYPGITISISNYSVIYHGETVEFPPRELELLYFLASHPNRVFSRDELLDKIWGYEYTGDTRTVDVHIKRIREKLNLEDKWEIKTVWRIGYKFEVE